jgi:hypothetical protein
MRHWSFTQPTTTVAMERADNDCCYGTSRHSPSACHAMQLPPHCSLGCRLSCVRSDQSPYWTRQLPTLLLPSHVPTGLMHTVLLSRALGHVRPREVEVELLDSCYVRSVR